ncbi:hypothetical protein AAMO2058_001077400 [Amorphochlora amoebiformis]
MPGFRCGICVVDYGYNGRVNNGTTRVLCSRNTSSCQRQLPFHARGHSHVSHVRGVMFPVVVKTVAGLAATAAVSALVMATIRSRGRGRRRRPTERKHVVVIKVGGDAITIKKNLETINEQGLNAAVKLIQSQYTRGRKMAIVHGAGSFGHHQAKEYNLSIGTRSRKRNIHLGIAKCRASVRKLNLIFVNALIKAGVPAVSVSPFPTISAKKKRIIRSGVLLSVSRMLLQDGMLPVIHGDVIYDDYQGHCVLSGDQILESLCDILRPKRAVFITGAPGIFDRPPYLPNARLIPRVDVNIRTGQAYLPADIKV